MEHELEIWVRQGQKETAYTFHCRTCGTIGSDHLVFRRDGDPDERVVDRARREAELDFEDHLAGRDFNQRGHLPEQDPQGRRRPRGNGAQDG